MGLEKWIPVIRMLIIGIIGGLALLVFLFAWLKVLIFLLHNLVTIINSMIFIAFVTSALERSGVSSRRVSLKLLLAFGTICKRLAQWRIIQQLVIGFTILIGIFLERSTLIYSCFLIVSYFLYQMVGIYLELLKN